jgi:hypothetical protein
VLALLLCKTAYHRLRQLLAFSLSEDLLQPMHGGGCALQGKGTKRKLKPHEVEGSAVVHKWRKERLK